MKTIPLFLIAFCLFSFSSISEARRIDSAVSPSFSHLQVDKNRVHFGYVVGTGFNTSQAQADAELLMWAEILLITEEGWELQDLEILDEGPIGPMQYFIDFKATFRRK